MKLAYEKPTVTIARYQVKQYMDHAYLESDNGCRKASNVEHGCEWIQPTISQ